jgi:hypothetical protein
MKSVRGPFSCFRISQYTNDIEHTWLEDGAGVPNCSLIV